MYLVENATLLIKEWHFVYAHIEWNRLYNPQIEMFARFKMKSSFHKTKRII